MQKRRLTFVCFFIQKLIVNIFDVSNQNKKEKNNKETAKKRKTAKSPRKKMIN